MGFRPRNPSPPEASCACLPVGRRRVQFCPALPVRHTPSAPPGTRYPMAAPEPGPAGPTHPRPPRNGHPYAQLAAGFGIGTTTAYRYVAEAVELLAALAPTLAEAARTASTKAFVLLDGTLLPIDRIAADRPFYSGKHKKHGMNVQVLADPSGRLLWASPALPGAVHDVRAAREHGTIAALTDAGITCWADKGYRGAGGTVRVPYWDVGRTSPQARRPSTGPTRRSGPWSSRPSPPSSSGGSFASCDARPPASRASSKPP
ncbi:hypothetical protein SUDANB54_03277 [Streptomyces sp. enrichment culture]